jgi:hypothetical protein
MNTSIISTHKEILNDILTTDGIYGSFDNKGGFYRFYKIKNDNISVDYNHSVKANRKFKSASYLIKKAFNSGRLYKLDSMNDVETIKNGGK